MAARPTVTVWSAQGESSGSLPLPAVFTAPIRLDVVQQVHSEFGSYKRGERQQRGRTWMMGRAGRGGKGGGMARRIEDSVYLRKTWCWGGEEEDPGGHRCCCCSCCCSRRRCRGSARRSANPQSRSPRTGDRLTPSLRTRVTRPLPSRGELDEPSPVSPVLVVEEPSDPDRPPSETCAEVDECSPRPRPGGSGTSR